jgi:hypothetical protein
MMKTEDDSPWSLFFDDQAANDYILRLVLDNLPEPLALHTPGRVGRLSIRRGQPRVRAFLARRR